MVGKISFIATELCELCCFANDLEPFLFLVLVLQMHVFIMLTCNITTVRLRTININEEHLE